MGYFCLYGIKIHSDDFERIIPNSSELSDNFYDHLVYEKDKKDYETDPCDVVKRVMHSYHYDLMFEDLLPDFDCVNRSENLDEICIGESIRNMSMYVTREKFEEYVSGLLKRYKLPAECDWYIGHYELCSRSLHGERNIENDSSS